MKSEQEDGRTTPAVYPLRAGHRGDDASKLAADRIDFGQDRNIRIYSMILYIVAFGGQELVADEIIKEVMDRTGEAIAMYLFMPSPRRYDESL